MNMLISTEAFLDMWENVPVELLHGRSDFQIVRDVPKTVRFKLL